jgi:hypothetical protein
MFAKISRRSVSMAHKALMAALLVAVLFGVLPAGQAHAYSSQGVIGRPGNLVLPAIQIVDVYTFNSWDFVLLGGSGPIVYRSAAATGSQTIQALYVIEQWNGSQRLVSAKSRLLPAQIAAANSGVQMVAPYMTPISSRGTFRFSWIFSWFSSTGALLGSTTIISTAASEHVCVTKQRLCQSSAGFFTTGGFRTGTW